MRHLYLQPAHIMSCSQVVTTVGHIQHSCRTQAFRFRHLCAICYLLWVKFMQYYSEKILHSGFPLTLSLLRTTNPVWIFQRDFQVEVWAFSNPLDLLLYRSPIRVLWFSLSLFWHSANKPGAKMFKNPPNIVTAPTFSDTQGCKIQFE